MRTKDYIDATYSLVEGGHDEGETLARLKAYLTKRGLAKLYPSVLRGLAEKFRRNAKTSRTKVIVARAEDTKVHEADIVGVLAEIHGEHDVVVDENIIGGFIVKGKNERIDRSFKQKLLHVYHQLTD